MLPYIAYMDPMGNECGPTHNRNDVSTSVSLQRPFQEAVEGGKRGTAIVQNMAQMEVPSLVKAPRRH